MRSERPVLWWPKLKSRGTILEKFSYRSILLHHSKQVFWTPDDESYMLDANFFQKTLCDWGNRHFYLFLAGFVWGLYGGGLTGKCQSFGRDLNFWPAPHTPRQFSQKMQGTDHILCAFWTADFMARPAHIGSGRCILMFQVSNRTIVCILKRSARLYGKI